MFRPGIPLPSAGTGTEAGQPRPVEDAPRPTAAERVRTLVESNGMASLSVPGVEDPDEPGLSAPGCRGPWHPVETCCCWFPGTPPPAGRPHTHRTTTSQP